MWRRKEPVGSLSAAEMRKALRKHVNAYQVHELDRLTDGRDHWRWFVGREGAARREFVFHHVSKMTADPDKLAKLVNGEATGDPVHAFILDGRWVARCPDCASGQEAVSRADAAFVCLNMLCLNVLNDHLPRPVVFPPPGVEKQLAETLLARRNPVNRNWDAQGLVLGKPESVADLKAENVAHGLPPAVPVELEG